MIIDGLFDFGIPTITNSNAATVSPYVFNAGSAKKVFSQIGSPPLKVKGHAVCTADDNPTLLVQLLAADNAALTTNPIVLGSTGIIVYGPDGATALASGADVDFEFKINEQKVAKQYYGLMVTLGGTNPDIAAGAGKASVVLDSQSNDYRAAAATP